MRLSLVTPVAFALALSGSTAAQYLCTFDNALAWPANTTDSSSSSSSSDGSSDAATASEVTSIVGGAQAQAICDADLDADCTEVDNGDGDDGMLSKRQDAPVSSLECTASESCYLYPTGYLICIDPNSGDFLDQFEEGNLVTGAHTTLSADDGSASATATDDTGSTTDAAGATTASATELATGMTTTTQSAATTASTTMATEQSSTTTSSASATSASVHSTGAAGLNAVVAWNLLLPAAVAPILAIAL